MDSRASCQQEDGLQKVRGYHVYMDKCTPATGDRFQVEIKEKDSHDRYALAVKVDGSGEGDVTTAS